MQYRTEYVLGYLCYKKYNNNNFFEICMPLSKYATGENVVIFDVKVESIF